MSKKSIKFDCSTCYYNNGDVCINHCSTLGKFKFDPYGYSISDLLEFKYKCDGYRPSLDTYDFVKKMG